MMEFQYDSIGFESGEAEASFHYSCLTEPKHLSMALGAPFIFLFGLDDFRTEVNSSCHISFLLSLFFFCCFDVEALLVFF